MFRMMRQFVSLSVALSLALITPAPVFAGSAAKPVEKSVSQGELQALMRNDTQLIYWTTLEERNPLVGGFALDNENSENEKPLWTIESSDPLVDQDPFFMRSQSWNSVAKEDCKADDVCFEKTSQGLLLQFGSVPKALLLKQAMTPILDTDEYLFFSADNQDIFRTKLNAPDPGEGFFFIAKKDLPEALEYNASVPIFFVPTVGNGWTGPQPSAFEFNTGDQLSARYVFPDKDNDPLQLDHTDIMALEKVGRNNLQLAQSWSALEGDVAANGVTLPKIGTTMGFGLQLTGQLPRFPSTSASTAKQKAAMIARAVGQAVLPQAEAQENNARRPTLRERLARVLGLREQASRPAEEASPEVPGIQQSEMFPGAVLSPPPQAEPPKLAAPIEENVQVAPTRSLWQRWRAPGILYGLTFGLAAAAYQDVDWKALITADMPQRITYISMIFGAVALTSYMLKISVYKDKLARLYPVGPDSERMAAAKGFLTIFSQGLWTSFAGISMTIRQILDFGKDRFTPNNKFIHKLWELTMGFALKASSGITTNWKTAILGWTFGLADATLVAVYLLIFAPWLMQHFGMSDVGASTVAYASASVFSQFVGYAQHGPHSYAQEVKMIHYQAAENEARRKMAGQGLDPDNPRNESKLHQLTAQEMEIRFKSVGLPGDDEFFFDPLSLWHKILRQVGYSADGLQGLTASDRDELEKQDFILAHRHLGLIKPALDSALQEAEKVQQASPSQLGAKTVQLLRWVIKNRGLTKPIAGRVVDAGVSVWGWRELKDAVNNSVVDWLANDKSPNFIGKYWAVSRGLFSYLAADATKTQREVRSVLFAMSTNNTEAVQDTLRFLPKSWLEKAGSPAAAGLAAELFHRHFLGYIEKDIQNVKKTEVVDPSLAARADAQLAKIPASDLFSNADPFERQIRRNMIISQLRTQDEAQKNVDEWQPRAGGSLARRQWRLALETALQMTPNPDDQISEQWISVAKTYAANLKGEKLRTFEALQWVRTQQFNYLFTQGFAKQVGLHLSDVESSDFVQKVMARATLASDAEMQGGRLVYYEKLSADEKKIFMAKVFTEQFINTYVQMAVHSDLYLKASDAQFPGRLQRVRKWLVGKPIEKIAAPIVHAAEMFGRNEVTSYQPGVISMLDRSIPFVPDLVRNFLLTLRYVPYAIGPAYLTQRYVFQIHYPYIMWVATILFGSTNGALVAVNNRLQRNLDLKPMGGIAEKLLFAWVHSSFTNPQVVIELMYAEPIVRNVENGMDAAVEKCEAVLRSVGSLGKNLVGVGRSDKQ